MSTKFLFFSLVLMCCASTFMSAKINKRFIDYIDDNGDINSSNCTDDCLYLYNTIISNMNTIVKPCENMYAFTCNDVKRNVQPEYQNNVISKIQTQAINILNSPIKLNELKYFRVDKQLFQQCIALGSDWQNEEYLAFEILRRQLMKYVKENRKWLDLEIKIHSLGFDYTFFDINVIDDPEEASNKIIILEPPLFKDTQTLINKVKTIMKYKYYSRKVNYFGVIDAFEDLFDFVREYLKEPMITFLESLEKIDYIVMQKYKNVQSFNIKTTIEDFNNFFEQLSEINEFAEIDWAMIIKLTFQNVDIQIMDKESIIIKNKPYFIELSKLLRKTSNEVIVSAILAKLITENLVYIDWNLAQSLEKVDKQSFCLKETKLFGVSHKIIHNIADRIDVSLLRKVEDIVTNIRDIFSNEIIERYSIFSREQMYLEHKLKLITDNLLDFIIYSPLNPHADLQLTPSYFFNIIKYREMLKRQKLKTLRDTVYVQIPFSIMEIEKARNRFILYALTNSGMLLSPTLPKGVFYGNYGIKISAFLYALMNENIFKDGIHYYNVPDWRAYPEYSDDMISCYRSIGILDYNRDQLTFMITESLGLQIAYRAMKRDNSIRSYDPFSLNLLLKNKLTMEQLFVITYVNDHCYVNGDIVNQILSITDIFPNIFHCNYYQRTEQCQIQTFGTPFARHRSITRKSSLQTSNK